MILGVIPGRLAVPKRSVEPLVVGARCASGPIRLRDRPCICSRGELDDLGPPRRCREGLSSPFP
ncbi:hypothetical protein LCGC14_2804350, partial [marine sediment metagenome]